GGWSKVDQLTGRMRPFVFPPKPGHNLEFLESAVLVRTLEPCKGESLDGWSNKPLELEHAVATAGGNHALSPCHCSPGYNPLRAETRVRLPLGQPPAICSCLLFLRERESRRASRALRRPLKG